MCQQICNIPTLPNWGFYKQKCLHLLGRDCGHNIEDLNLEQLFLYYKDLVAT